MHGEVFLNHPEAIHSFGVKGDANYNILITKDNGNLSETLFTDISPNSTINITNDTIVIKTDGNGGYNFTGNVRFKLNDDFITMNGGDSGDNSGGLQKLETLQKLPARPKS